MRDVGLNKGVRSMWHKNKLRDYTIKVEDQEFRVHKLVLASVSDYFEVMICESFAESEKDWVELKGLSANIVAKLLNFIYAGEEDSIQGDTMEILKCAIYLQMPLVTDYFVEKLLGEISYKNCFEIYFMLLEYSLNEAAEKAKRFIKTNCDSVVECLELENVTYEEVQTLVDVWEKSEFELFQFINKWVALDCDDRNGYTNQFLGQVRFSLMSANELDTIKKMDIFSDGSSSWHDSVEQAERYHQLPMNLKVLERSVQSTLRREPSPVFFSSKSSAFFNLDKDNKWQKHENKALGTPTFPVRNRAFGIVVNNFFVVCTREDENREWYIFDPHTLTWFQMASMPRSRTGFALVHHGDHLYTVGGEYKTTNEHGPNPYVFEPCYGMEQYSFKTNTWSVISMPFAVVRHAASVVGDRMYISGGSVLEAEAAAGNYRPSQHLHSLDLSAPNQEWEKKPPCDKAARGRRMYVARIGSEEVPFILITQYLITYFSPSKDKWEWLSKLSVGFRGDMFGQIHLMDYGLLDNSPPFHLNVDVDGYGASNGSDYDRVEHHPRDHICLSWNNTEVGQDVLKKLPLENFPLCPEGEGEWDYNMFSAVLAVPEIL